MEERIQEIATLFEHRDRIVKEESRKIFARISHVLKGIDSFLSNTDQAYADGHISWEDVQYVEENSIVVVFGMLSFLPGSTFSLGGKEVEVTESNADAFQKMVRIGLPLALIATNSEEEIVKFLGGVSQEHEIVEQNNVTDLHSVAPFPISTTSDFEWDKLTDDQKKKLIINNVSEKPN